MSVLITGGSGKTGRRLADQLARRGAAFHVASRRPAVGRRFDWLDRQTWAAALEGVHAAYLVAPPGDTASVMIDFAAQALASGCLRFVLLSASLLPAGGPGAGQVHAWLAAEAPEWAVLRPSWFMQNVSEGVHAETIRLEDRIYSAAGDGRIAFVSADDIAAVAAAILTGSRTPNADAILTGPEALDYDGVASLLSESLGRTIRHVRISVQDLAARHVAHGLPVGTAGILAGMDALIAQGAEDRTTDAVMRITGRPPINFKTFCRSLGPARG